ncbi:hypothetical protein MPER_12811 [Moniliophthora perniciosa FA553]|nr:hypothetical protein MPER_12811 [Moniliophthora perniciosa FA553]
MVRPAPLWKTQLWRAFLALGITGFGGSAATPVVKKGELEEGEVGDITPEHTLSQKQRDIVYQALSCCTQRSGVSINEEVAARTDARFWWQGKEHKAADLDDPKLVREILWELTDLNFRCELLAMDLARRPCSTALDERERELDMVLRDESVRQCFPRESHGIAQHTQEVEGLAASDIRKRAPYLMKLQELMRSWRGSESQQWATSSRTDEQLFVDSELIVLERRLAAFYTQAFFNEFGRPCTLPHRPC